MNELPRFLDAPKVHLLSVTSGFYSGASSKQHTLKRGRRRIIKCNAHWDWMYCMEFLTHVINLDILYIWWIYLFNESISNGIGWAPPVSIHRVDHTMDCCQSINKVAVFERMKEKGAVPLLYITPTLNRHHQSSLMYKLQHNKRTHMQWVMH